MKLFPKFILLTIGLFLIGCDNSSKTIENNLDGSTKTYRLKPSPIGKEILEAEVDFVCPPFRADGKTNIQFELSMVNNFRQNLILNSIDIINANGQETLIKSFDDNYLENNFIHLGIRNTEDSVILEPGRKGLIVLQIEFDDSQSIPNQIFHRLQVGISNKGSIVEVPFEVALIKIPNTNSIELGLPFKKGKWFYTAESHKDSRFITQGTPTYPQRFAIDWAYIEDNGVFVKEDMSINENYPTYGQELLAVADGIIVEIKNDIPDNVPEQIDVKITRETVCGNYVILDIGNDIYAVYAHLIPDSFKVTTGEKVTKGQVIGLLGNSGNSDGPHLHFHLETKSPRVLGGEGIPYHFEKFNQLKKYSFEELGTIFEGESLDLKNLNTEIRFNEMPIGNGVVEFE
ncbi:hypothetical protein GGR42_002829 [Saonia flava]|uniref:M23ase beta-sheet core domain-containing protein n=1 Tax=Saonia flava TaxID=523696 RepID=A0A846QWI4_9FLAO|nr:M23 family metallopeptidase [Saonia flava]NJB72338.1 hypothetical protein [Saonia flava]